MSTPPARLLDLAPKGNAGDGWLIPIENLRQVPFAIQRVYYIYGTPPGVRRGKHAHRCLRQMAVCLHGSCRFHLDDGRRKQEFLLNRPDQGLLIEPMVWHEMDEFSAGCVVLMLTDGLYDEQDYLRDYAEFRLKLPTKDHG